MQLVNQKRLVEDRASDSKFGKNQKEREDRKVPSYDMIMVFTGDRKYNSLQYWSICLSV